MKSLIRDDRGMAVIQLVGIIIAPIIIAMLAGATISAIRTGSGVTEALTRNAQAQVMFTDFKNTVAAASTATAGTNKVTLTIDPQQLPPSIPVSASAYGSACLTTTWELIDDGLLRTLSRTTQTHVSDCASRVRSESNQKLTGLSPSTVLVFENTAGRTLTLTGSTLTPAAETAPVGVTPQAWASTDLGAIILDGVVQEMFADRPTHITAVTTPSIAP